MDPAANLQFNVLILEDDNALSELLRRRLERIGVVCRSATSADSAHVQIESSTPDLLVLDYYLSPGGTGIDFYRTLLERGLRIPAILATGFGDERVLAEALRLGIRDFLPKNESFLDNLPFTVQRLLQDIQRERRLQQMEHERIAYEATTATLEAAGVASFVWELSSGSTTASKQVESLLETDASSLKAIRDFVRFIHPADRRAIWASLKSALASHIAAEHEFRLSLPSGHEKWVRLKGRFETDDAGRPRRFLAMLWDDSAKHNYEIQLRRSHTELTHLAERLQLSMLEIHHRVKNSFQIVNSLLNMELRRKDHLEKEDIRRVISYVQGLALIHDMLTDHDKRHTGKPSLQAGQLIESIAASLSPGLSQFDVQTSSDDLEVSPRVASSLSVIVTELFMDSCKYCGDHGVSVIMRRVGPGRGQLMVRCSLRSAADPSSAADGSSPKPLSSVSPLVEFLARSDLASAVEFSDSASFRTVSIDFPVVNVVDGWEEEMMESLPSDSLLAESEHSA